MQASLHYGLQQAAQAQLSEQQVMRATIGDQIQTLLDKSPDAELASQVRDALKDPMSVIEIRSGDQVQTATRDMPLRELIAPATGELEIVISKPHVGG
jgi:hypothetical protein